MKNDWKSSVKLVALYLVPGILIATFYYLATPIMLTWDFPSVFTLSLAIMVVLIPVQLGYLVIKKSSRNEQSLLREILDRQQTVSVKNFILYVVVLILIAGLVYGLLSNSLNQYLKDEVFNWIPSWARILEVETVEPQQTFTIFALFIFGNILGPIVEEIYFRGYLLDRTPGSPVKRSLFNAFLFALYHFWSPWDIVTRTIAVAPYAYVTTRTNNLWIAVAAHVGVNMLSSIPVLLMLF